MISRVEDSVVAAGRARAGWIRRGLPTAAAWASVALAGAWLALLPGCGEKEEAAVAPPPPPPPPPEPDRVELSLLEDELRPDARIAFPASSAPYDPTLARAVYRFAGALASGDAGAMRPMLDQPSREVLDWMRDDGTWSDSTASIEAVAVPHLDQTPATAREARSAEVYLAVQSPGGSYVLGWEARRAAGSWVFGGIESTDAELPLAEMWIDQPPRALEPGGEPEPPARSD